MEGNCNLLSLNLTFSQLQVYTSQLSLFFSELRHINSQLQVIKSVLCDITHNCKKIKRIARFKLIILKKPDSQDIKYLVEIKSQF